MPELPDVELFKRLAEQYCLGSIITRVLVADPDSLEGASPASLQRRLKGRPLRSCRRHGKVLFIEVDTAGTLAMHFGTNGSLQHVVRDEQEPPYVRLRLDFSDDDRLAYVNPRRIGHVHLVQSSDAYIAEAGLGPDALDPSFDAAAFSAMLGNRKQPIKSLLMDQARVAGIGNIYADEILFQAKLHPAVSAALLDGAARHRLFDTMKTVLQTAVRCGAGAENFTDRLPKDFLLPERRDGGHCPRCGTALRADKRGGRAGYYCPKCQPEPSA
jgi:formamidopyrimidine-DNA glycosylase